MPLALSRALAILIASVLLVAPAGQVSQKTLFADEFAGTSLDRAKWNVIVTGSGWRTVNNEQQAYIDSTEVLSVGDGVLTIHPHFHRAFKAPDGKTFDFVSGRIDTRDKFDFTYG